MAGKEVLKQNESREDIELQKMFSHKSKLMGIVNDKWLNSYKENLLMLRNMQCSGEIPIHPENKYLGENELALNIYKNKYYLKDLDGNIIESRPEDTFARLASYISAVEKEDSERKKWAVKFYNALYKGYFLPGGRVIAGSGDLYRLKTLANCFVSVIEKDNIESIYKAAYECARTYSFGGGIGVDISVLRPRDSVVHNAADKSTGAVSFTEIYSLTTGLIGQSGRRGALMLTLDVKHPDVFHFINVKKVPNWVTKQIVEQCKWSGLFNDSQLEEVERQVRENTQVRFANISLKVTDEFMNSVIEENQFGRDKILLYKKLDKITISEISQDEVTHYSYGIPSKKIENYELEHVFDSVEDMNSYLKSSYGISMENEGLADLSRRDLFGDYVIPLEGKNHDLAVKFAGDFMLYFNSPQTGEIKRMVKARDVWDQFVDGNHQTAEPGLIFWSTMAKYSPSNYVGKPIASTNPCVASDSLISTENGLERIDSVQAENILVDNRALDYESSSGELISLQYGSQLVKPLQRIRTGIKECYKLETKSGYEITATHDHRILTQDGWKPLGEITENDSVLIQSGAGKFSSTKNLPFEVNNIIVGKNNRAYRMNLPNEWSRELGIFLGWLVGDGYYNENYHKAGLVFAKEDEDARRLIQPIMEKYCNKAIKEIRYPNGCVQIRNSSKYFIEFLKNLGVKQAFEEREVPSSLFTATEEAVIGFLEGLFSSDGTISLGSKSRNYLRLNSSSLKLLKQVQLLLLNLGIKSAIYDHSTKSKVFRYENKNGDIIKYKTSGINFELNVSKENARRFIEKIFFIQGKNQGKVSELKAFEFYSEKFADKVKSKTFAGKKEVWDITEPKSHSFIANGIIVHNCGEVPLEDGGACNLGSINLSRFVSSGYTDNAKIEWEELGEATSTLTRFLDNVISWNEVLNPLEKQRSAASETRRIGLGFMGIADMMNQLGIEYDSEEGIVLLEKISRFIANVSYLTSSEIAKEKGQSAIFNYDKYSRCPFFQEILSPEVKQSVKLNGLRNIAILSIAPTGTISNIILGFVNNTRHYVGVSGGIEPIFSLYYTRRSESFGNIFFKVFHSTVQAYIDMNNIADKVQDAKSESELRTVIPKHFFRTAHYIDPMNRVRIQGIVQKYIDHSISSTVNLPEDIEPEVISNVYIEAWKHGLKGITIYRDGSRYPILSVEGKQTEFQIIKKHSYIYTEKDGASKTLKGDSVIKLDTGKLTTVYHALKTGIMNGRIKPILTSSKIQHTQENSDDKKQENETKVVSSTSNVCVNCGDN